MSFECQECDYKVNMQVGLKKHKKMFHVVKIECLNVTNVITSKYASMTKETQYNVSCSQNWVFECEECDYKVNLQVGLKKSEKRIQCSQNWVFEFEECDYKNICKYD